ncbi:MAG: hypothetical protein ETSY1_32225 [Candidatus Entotheonella factor]|uniref:DUF3108 domain-containing protein n=1 Tax=Entotheonella factor TaxID=1429438 RepID=W4LBF3_ENTF1|nr:DUF3108 domain-containing protein [Candidatus Entotheonella palauensis]ETW95070.1 MAG: hypothetical protein ETSY1_32225 [Candidatus Entotheonella factor]
MRILYTLSLMLASLHVAAPIAVATAPLPFRAGESLVFEVSWLRIPVGTATMRVEPIPDHAIPNALRLISTARTYRFFDTFHKVDDHAESIFDPHTRLSQSFRIRQHEGRYRSHHNMVFDQSSRRVTFQKRDQTPKEIAIPTAVQDPLSVLYLVRTLPLAVGETVVVPICNRGKTWFTKIRVLQRERLNLPIGEVNTIKIQPLLQAAGLFRHKGDMFIWLSDDAYRVPVQLKSNIKIGAIRALLMNVQGVELTAKP